MRMIDADALMEVLEKIPAVGFKNIDNQTYVLVLLAQIYNIIKQQPTIEERKTGKWIEYDSDEDKYDIIKCSCCNHTFTVDSFHWTDIGFTKNDFNFCPNCGADMRGGQDE